MQLRIELFPADLGATVAFYTEALGFAVDRDERGRDPGYVSFVRGSTRIGASAPAEQVDASARRPPTGVEIVLEVDDLEAERERVRRAGRPVTEEITERPWGLADFRLVDPDGYSLRITTR